MFSAAKASVIRSSASIDSIKSKWFLISFACTILLLSRIEVRKPSISLAQFMRVLHPEIIARRYNARSAACRLRSSSTCFDASLACCRLAASLRLFILLIKYKSLYVTSVLHIYKASIFFKSRLITLIKCARKWGEQYSSQLVNILILLIKSGISRDGALRFIIFLPRIRKGLGQNWLVTYYTASNCFINEIALWCGFGFGGCSCRLSRTNKKADLKAGLVSM